MISDNIPITVNHTCIRIEDVARDRFSFAYIKLAKTLWKKYTVALFCLTVKV